MRFQHEGGKNSFRGWLWGVTNNHIKYYLRQRVRQPQGIGGSCAAKQLADIVAEDESTEILTIQTTTQNEKRALLRRALELVQTDFKEATWQAFWYTTIEGRSAADVAEELNITTNAVYLAKSRILRRLREEFEGLLELPT